MAQFDNWYDFVRSLLNDGWLFYEGPARPDPTFIRGYTPFALPSGIANTAANRRKLNRPFWTILQRTTQLATDPWQGILRVGAASTLVPWVAGATAPFNASDAQWNVAANGHYTNQTNFQNGLLNTTVITELDSARDSPAATFTGTYGDCSDGQVASNALRDLFARIAV